MKTDGVPFGLPVLSKKMPTPRSRLTGAPPILDESRSTGASPFSASLGDSVNSWVGETLSSPSACHWFSFP